MIFTKAIRTLAELESPQLRSHWSLWQKNLTNQLTVTYLEFQIQVCFSPQSARLVTCIHSWKGTFVILQPWTWSLGSTTLTFKLVLDKVKVNQCIKYVRQRSLSSKVTHTHIHPTECATWTILLTNLNVGATAKNSVEHHQINRERVAVEILH